ncbi:hypothetical protein Tco_0803261 [Tanacetum coccineum]|uniref:Uncharacterized protein n=1 Tax=Tanacetum coccineum TaxID=301880 RepID=A0ABQ5A5G6_9ASTR
MESLKKIKINRPLLKEIRQTDDYAKHMKNLVANKPKTKEEEVRMNPRSFSLLQNQLPPKEQDLGGKLKPINMVIEMADNTKCTPKGLVENLHVKIDKLIFPIDFVILDIVEDIRMPIILGRPLLATAHAKVDIFRKSISLEDGNEKVIFKIRNSFDATIFESVRAMKIQDSYEVVVLLRNWEEQEDPWKIKKIDEANLERHQDLTPVEKPKVHWCKAIPQEKEYEREYWASRNPYSNVCDGGDLPNDNKKRYWESINDSKRGDLEWEGLSLND